MHNRLFQFLGLLIIVCFVGFWVADQFREDSDASVVTIPLDVAAIQKSRPDVRFVSYTETTDRGEVTHIGVSLRSLLACVAPVDTMPDWRNLTDAVVVVRGRDGFVANLSAAAIACDVEGGRYFLSDTEVTAGEDGQPVETDYDTLRLIVPDDARHVRWVRDVVSVELVRLGTSSGACCTK